MRQPSVRIHSIILALLVLASIPGCASHTESWGPDAILRQPVDTPDHFEPGTNTNVASTTDTPACLSPMVDPRDRTEIVLARSAHGFGDYDVPDSRYGVGPNELLRLDCATGTVVGIVRR